jgi:UDP-glucose 4-epimerase
MKEILVTGGLGYIGSHFCADLDPFKYSIVIIDNCINSSKKQLSNIKKINKKINIDFYNTDLQDSSAVNQIFKNYNFDSVVHFAALKSVPESIEKPEIYYKNNVIGLTNLIMAMRLSCVDKIIFSSSAAIYGEPESVPIDEKHPIDPNNPYSMSKFICEKIIENESVENELKSIVLRYFNPAGYHSSNLLFDYCKGSDKNLFSSLCNSFDLNKDFLINGSDYDTIDGTPVRDFIHIDDLSNAHILALDYIEHLNNFDVINLGSSKGYSVKEVFKEFCSYSKKDIKHKFLKRRRGDIAISIASNTKALNVLKWSPSKDLKEMVESTYENHKCLKG